MIFKCNSVNDLISQSNVVVYCNDDSYEKPKMINSYKLKIIDPWRTIQIIGLKIIKNI